MKDSWLLYDYLQRWWRLLLLCCALGILGAYLVNEPTVYAKEYSATATLAITDHKWVPSPSPIFAGSRPPEALVTIESGIKPTQEEATAVINTKLYRLSEFNERPLELREIVIHESALGNWAWWKGITLGAVIGILAAIGIIYVWTDVQAYSRREQAP